MSFWCKFLIKQTVSNGLGRMLKMFAVENIEELLDEVIEFSFILEEIADE
jgi:hypothetical protein